MKVDPLMRSRASGRWRALRARYEVYWDSFEDFINDVGYPPEGARAHVPDPERPAGPTNFIWRKVDAPQRDKKKYLRKLFGISN